MPKQDVVAAVSIIMQRAVCKWPPTCRQRACGASEELQDFGYKLTQAANTTYGAAQGTTIM